MSRKKKKTKKQKISGAVKKSEKKNISLNASSSDPDHEFQKAVQYHQTGQLEQAEKIYRKILESHPNHSDSLHLFGVLSHQTGKKDMAADLIRQAIRIDPNRPTYHNNLGIVFQSQGKLNEAIACYQNTLKIKSDFADAYNNMGFALQDQKKLDEAIECYQKALEIKPNYVDAYNNIGTAFKDQGKTEDAIAAYQKAIQFRPDYAEAYHNMGMAFKDQRKPDQALACYQKALEIRPEYVEVLNNMGNLLKDCGKFNEAVSCYQKALEIKPDFAEAFNSMGTAFKEKGRFNDALACYQKVLQIKPDDVSAYLNIGNTLQDQGKADQAILCYQKALEIKPDYAIAYDNMRNAYIYQGKLAEAISCCEKSLEIRPDPGIEIRKALMLPVIYESKEQIEYYRNKICEEINTLKNKGITLRDPHKQVGSTNFYLAYHGLNDREIQQKIASFYLETGNWKLETGNWKLETGNWKLETGNWKLETGNWKLETRNSKLRPKFPVSSFKFQAPSFKFPIKIGIVSMHLYNMNQQTIGKLNRGIIKNLSREKFYVKLFRFPGGESHLIESINEGADEVVDLPTEMKPAAEIIAGHSLDVLFYPDIGMDSLTYFLAFSRLAPVQCVTWGHPVTTGIPNMDYFISSELLEPPGAQDHYSEQLVLLKRLPVYYYPPELPEEWPSREKFGLPHGYHLYICPQAPFKFHPDFDAALGAILRRDPRGLLILIEGHAFEHWAKLLLDRFRKTFPDVIDRVRFLKAMPTKDFLCLLRVADALLEPPYFGGGNTTYESFACGVPIVTWPGPFMRGRVTLGCYKQMGVTDCIASDPQSYIEIALRLANDKAWKAEVSDKIRANAGAIFEDADAVRELERFFERAVRKCR
ncbi:tetratricopeptide repeat protein [Desulfonema magnum]|uniref:protein O-GlcNAc transferase n=1 Tax=Desulfonema magnum TaxID=45655 RepID=A0A975BT31_9BACT|nr:glycosyltransferase family 41 protein [Desulfonema magnum]QTA91146.1 Tetratricopeptide repeat-containing protein [Desulfonema magnum]